MFIEKIDDLISRINLFKVDPQFTEWARERASLIPDFAWTDEEILRRLVILIAYSNNANADKVTKLIEHGAFDQIFKDYSVEETARLSPETLILNYWPIVKEIRFKYKIGAMVRCAASLLSIRQQHGSFMNCLKSAGLKGRITSEEDIQSFWAGFDQVRSHLMRSQLPYFANFTSLCHLLLDRGFDCVKPDLAVMRAAVDLGIVPPPPKQKRNPEKNRTHPEESLRTVVQSVQKYGVIRNIRPPVIDIYLLIRGGQSGVVNLVKSAYYQLPAKAGR